LRTILVYFLAGVLSNCPLLCRAVEPGCRADQGEEGGPGLPGLPTSCPDDGVSCIGAGAIPADQVSPPVPNAVGHLAIDLWSLAPLFLPPQARRHAVRALPSPASPGDTGTLRALLQNFRF
jgi:hypothetical protein